MLNAVHSQPFDELFSYGLPARNKKTHRERERETAEKQKLTRKISVGTETNFLFGIFLALSKLNVVYLLGSKKKPVTILINRNYLKIH